MVDPTFLLPSEEARLVYGQLKRMNCHQVAERFLNMSPHLEECRDHVQKTRTCEFVTQAYCLSLEDILNQYLTMRCLILDEMNGSMPDSDQPYSDPAAALKFLLSLNEVHSDMDTDSGIVTESRPYSINRVGDMNTSISLNQAPSFERATEPCDNNADINLSSDSDSTATRSCSCSIRTETHLPVRHEYDLFPRLRRKNRLLDDLYASTESLDTLRKKKTVKVLKPRQTTLKSSLEPEAACNLPTCEDSTNVEEKSAILDGIFNSEISLPANRNDNSVFMSRLNAVDLGKNMSTRQLRSYTKTKEEIAPVNSPSKNIKSIKNRKKSSFSSSVDATVRDLKSSKNANSAEEGDMGVDIMRISEMLSENPKWPELIAQNINKTMSETPKKNVELGMNDTDSVFKSIAEKTLSADICDEVIHGLLTCTRSLTSDEPGAETDLNFMTANNSEENISTHFEQQIGSARNHSKSADQTTKNNASLENERLQENVNEFIRFDRNQTTINSNGSDVIFIRMETESNTPTDDFLIRSHNQMLNKNCVVCDEPAEDEIINLCEEIPENWTVHPSPMPVPAISSDASSLTDGSTKRKLQLSGLLVPLSGIPSKNTTYRRIAPKPDQNILASDRTPAKTSVKRLKK